MEKAEKKRKERPHKKCNLLSVEDVRAWLSQPEYQIRTALEIIKWEGATPYISVWPTDRLAELMKDRYFALVVLEQHNLRKSIKFVGETIENA